MSTLLSEYDTETDQVLAVAFSPDDKLLAVADSRNKVHLVTRSDGIYQHLLETPGSGNLFGLQFSPDGKRLAVTKAHRFANIWNVASGELETQFEAHNDDVTQTIFIGPEGKWLATASADYTVKIWSTSDWKLQATLAGHEYSVRAISVTADGNVLSSLDSRGVAKVWSLPDGTNTATFKDKFAGTCLTISPCGNYLVGEGDRNKLLIWSVVQKKTVGFLEGYENGGISSVRFSPNGKLLAFTPIYRSEPTVRLWDFDSRKEVEKFPVGGLPVLVAFNSKGDQISWGNFESGKAPVWQLDGQ